jgi:hypothetical protein
MHANTHARHQLIHMYIRSCSLSCLVSRACAGPVLMSIQGVDAGGVRKEFFQLVIRGLFDPSYGMRAVLGVERTLCAHTERWLLCAGLSFHSFIILML